MERSKPFARAQAFMAALAALIATPGMTQTAALMDIGHYQSRGHGRGIRSGKKWGPNPSGKYTGVTNGAREVARLAEYLQEAVEVALAPASEELDLGGAG